MDEISEISKFSEISEFSEFSKFSKSIRNGEFWEGEVEDDWLSRGNYEALRVAAKFRNKRMFEFCINHPHIGNWHQWCNKILALVKDEVDYVDLIARLLDATQITSKVTSAQCFVLGCELENMRICQKIFLANLDSTKYKGIAPRRTMGSCDLLTCAAMRWPDESFIIWACDAHRRGEINLANCFNYKELFYYENFNYRDFDQIWPKTRHLLELVAEDFEKFEPSNMILADIFTSRFYFYTIKDIELFRKLFRGRTMIQINSVCEVFKNLVGKSDKTHLVELFELILGGVVGDRAFEKTFETMVYYCLGNTELMTYFVKFYPIEHMKVKHIAYVLFHRHNYLYEREFRFESLKIILDRLTQWQLMLLFSDVFYSIEPLYSDCNVYIWLLEYLKSRDFDFEYVKYMCRNTDYFWYNLVFNIDYTLGIVRENRSAFSYYFSSTVKFFYDMGWPGIHHSYQALTYLAKRGEVEEFNWYLERVSFPKDRVAFNCSCAHVKPNGKVVTGHPLCDVHDEFFRMREDNQIAYIDDWYDQSFINEPSQITTPVFRGHTISESDLALRRKAYGEHFKFVCNPYCKPSIALQYHILFQFVENSIRHCYFKESTIEMVSNLVFRAKFSICDEFLSESYLELFSPTNYDHVEDEEESEDEEEGEEDEEEEEGEEDEEGEDEDEGEEEGEDEEDEEDEEEEGEEVEATTQVVSTSTFNRGRVNPETVKMIRDFYLRLFKLGSRLNKLKFGDDPRMGGSFLQALIIFRRGVFRRAVKEYLYSPWGRYAIEHLELVGEGGEVDEEERVKLREMRNLMVERILAGRRDLRVDELLSRTYYLPDGSGVFDLNGGGRLSLKQLLYRIPTKHLRELC